MSSGEVYPLVGNQQGAADPEESVWLSASAGTGKTQVLSARVLRLLLRPDVQPEQILCLTFTKAGAAEMAVRINAVLARWVRIDEGRLGKELIYLGASNNHETRARARTLFASVLDCPGGGLRIDTIHAFSQWLLANFPDEAGLMPGMRPMEDRERHLLSRQVLGDMLVEAEQAGDRPTLDAVEHFTIAKGADALQAWLMRCAKARELWFGRRGWQPPMAPQVKQLLGIPSDASEVHLAEMCDNDTFDTASLLRCKQTLSAWETAMGREGNAAIEAWLARDPLERARTIDELYGGLFTSTTDAPKQLKNILKRDPEYGNYIDKVQENIRLIRDFRTLLELADFLTPALELGRAFALRWDEAKAREGLLDFDDLIERAASLLKEQVAGDWIRFKLDRQFDHILVDEAQDTNEAQWRIIDALIDDFFVGEGAAGDKVRTIFTVGDTKQAIFGFQGTSPEHFQKAKERVAAAMKSANVNAAAARVNRRHRELRDLDLGQSFRTAVPVLEFVDRAIAAIGPGDMGLTDGHHPHVGQDRPGLVTLWNPVHDERGQEGDDPEEEGQENWLARHDRKLAEKIATQVARWTSKTQPFALQKGTHRNARPGDIMVLVRSRKELAGLIVARLHSKGVPVAGVDRLRLGEPLAVKDLMSALRFALQPLDDLELADLLVSPLVGWTQDDLLAHVPRAKGKRLWHHLREHADPFVQATVARLRELLALADFETPQALLQWMLVGPWQGRAKLVARLGREANDPIDELLNAAFGYEASHTASLAGFIQWFDAGEGELKRDPDDAPDLVRVMTVHGSKGLQAPIVILADATSAPGKVRDVELAKQVAGQGEHDARKVPMPSLGKEMQVGRVADAYEAAKDAELQEHWRLLYVAMTRAEEGLFIGGSLGPKAKNGPPEDSWYARLAPLFGEDALDDDLWGARREWGERAPPVAAQTEAITPEKLAEPAWLRRSIGPEPRPPRPLAPSSAGEDQGSDPPLPPEVAREAARRGVLIHALLERLPDIAPEDRPPAAARWLERQARELDEAARQEIAARALEVLAHPDLAEVFSHASLAEAPLAATVEGVVIAGIADRLLVTPEQVTVVDYKTARRPPARLEDIPESTLRQMAAYVAALEVIHPGRTVRAAIVYTQTPQIFELPQELVGLHKNAFHSAQQSYATSPVE